MKIKKLPNTKRVVVEFEEFIADCDPQGAWAKRRDSVVEHMTELAPRRTAYNMWEFKTEQDAQQALFVLGLKS